MDTVDRTRGRPEATKFSDQLEYLWGQYIDQVKFLCTLIGGTLVALVTFTLREMKAYLGDPKVLVGLWVLIAAFVLALFWRWASQWSMETEVLGDSDDISAGFEELGRDMYVTGTPKALAGGTESAAFGMIRGYMKLAGPVVLCLYVAGLFMLIAGFTRL